MNFKLSTNIRKNGTALGYDVGPTKHGEEEKDIFRNVLHGKKISSKTSEIFVAITEFYIMFGFSERYGVANVAKPTGTGSFLN